MIIDGVEVLYTMRNGKIVDPNIPTDGLVCYLDTRGKYNTDIYRNTLLDLSGNGNHGTLQNFSFADGSGYDNDSSGGTGGLQFDGVDDYIEAPLSQRDLNDPFTAFIDFELTELPSIAGQSCKFGSTLYIHKDNNKLYIEGSNSVNGVIFAPYIFPSKGRFKVLYVYKGTFADAKIYINGIKYTLKGTTLPDGSAAVYTWVKDLMPILGGGPKGIYRKLVWNRALTDEEIQQLMEVE